MGRLASSKCWICLTVQCWSMVRLAGAADLQHLAVARSALLSRPAVENPVQIGELGSHLAAFNPRLAVLARFATLPGDIFAWQQVGRLAVSVQHGQVVCKFKVACSAVLEHGEVGRGCRFATSCSGQICFASKTCSWNLCADWCSWAASGQEWPDLFCPKTGSWNVATLSGDSFAWQQIGNLQCQCSMQHGQDSAAWLEWLQICNILQWPHLCNQDLQLEPCADWCSWAASGSELGWFDQCSWLLSTPRLAWSVDFGRFAIKLDFLDSAVLEHSQVGRGSRFATSCSGQICFASKTCRLVFGQ